MQKGISMVSLIITIITIILLAAIVIFSGLETPANASLAKFISDFNEYSTIIRNDYIARYHDYSMHDLTRTEAQIYYEIASGREDLDMNTVPVSNMTVSEVENQYGKIFPYTLSGKECYEIIHDTNINGITKEKEFYTATERHYVTDNGVAFVLPGYPEYGNGDAKKWWINEKQYYTGEPVLTPTFSGDDNAVKELYIKDIKITSDPAGLEEAENNIYPDTKLYINFSATEGDKPATVSPQLPFEITRNGIYDFTITGSKGQTKNIEVTVKNYRQKSLADILKPGDYVAYSPVSAQYTLNATDVGSDNTQEVSTETANWRVIYSNPETEEVLLTTDKSVNSNITLGGILGYKMGFYKLDDTAKALYSNKSLGISARSMTVDDINKICNYEPNTTNAVRYAYYLSDDSNNVAGSTTLNNKTYQKAYVTKSGDEDARFFESDHGGKEGTELWFTYKTPTTNLAVYATQTYYSYNPQSKNSILGNILGSSYSWLASKSVTLNASGESLGLRKISNTELTAETLYTSTNVTNFVSCGLRPVISLDSSKLWIDDSNLRINGSSVDAAYILLKK